MERIPSWSCHLPNAKYDGYTIQPSLQAASSFEICLKILASLVVQTLVSEYCEADVLFGPSDAPESCQEALMQPNVSSLLVPWCHLLLKYQCSQNWSCLLIH